MPQEARRFLQAGVGGEPRHIATAKEQAVALDQRDAGRKGRQAPNERRGGNVRRLATSCLVSDEPVDVVGAVEAAPGIFWRWMSVNKSAAHIGVERGAADSEAVGCRFGSEKAVLWHGRRPFLILINFINIDDLYASRHFRVVHVAKWRHELRSY